jgi:dihydroorotate dehydrogenase (NAD+) catalytic subunit
MVNQVRHACPDTPIIGCGGISRAEDVIEMLMAGANAVEIGAANLRDPHACAEIISHLPGLMQELKIKHLQDIIGIV